MKLSGFIQILKSIHRDNVNAETIPEEVIKDVYVAYTKLSEADREFIGTELLKDYIVCHRPILGSKIKQRLEVLSRVHNIGLRDFIIKTVIVSTVSTIAGLIVVYGFVQIHQGEWSIASVIKNIGSFINVFMR